MKKLHGMWYCDLVGGGGEDKKKWWEMTLRMKPRKFI